MYAVTQFACIFTKQQAVITCSPAVVFLRYIFNILGICLQCVWKVYNFCFLKGNTCTHMFVCELELGYACLVFWLIYL